MTDPPYQLFASCSRVLPRNPHSVFAHWVAGAYRLWRSPRSPIFVRIESA